MRNPRDIGARTVIAFAAGCSYRRRLEEWLGHDGVVPSQVMEFGPTTRSSRACAPDAGIAIVPRSVLKVANAEKQVAVSPLPARTGAGRAPSWHGARGTARSRCRRYESLRLLAPG